MSWAVALAVLVLAVVAVRSGWEDVGGAGGLPGWGPSVAAVACNVVANVVLALAWRRQVALSGAAPPGAAVSVSVWSSSQLSRLLFPGAPVGARALLAHRHGVRRAVSAWTTVLETVWMLALDPLVVFATLPAWGEHAAGWRWLGVVALLPAALLLWILVRPSRALRRVAVVMRRLPVLRRLVPDDVEDVAVDLRPGDAADLFARYALNHLLRIGAFVVLFVGLVDAPGGLVLAAVGANALGRFVGMIAVFAPGGIGPREGVTALVLAPVIGSGVLVLVAAARLAEILAEAIVLAGGHLAARLGGSVGRPA